MRRPTWRDRLDGIWLDWTLPTLKRSRLVRRLMPWWLLEVIMRRQRICRVQVVMWKQFGNDEWSSWDARPSCWDGPGEGYDYCAKWPDYESFKAGTGQESYWFYHREMERRRIPR